MERSPNNPVNRAEIDSAESLDRIEELMKKLSTSTEKLSESSKRLEYFTLMLIFLTVIFAIIPIIELSKDFIPKYVVAVLILVFLAFIVVIVRPLMKIGELMMSQK